MTFTLVPYRTCVSSRPTSQSLPATVILEIHVRGFAGLARAGWSTERARHGRTHSVATLTATQHVPEEQRAGVEAAAGVLRLLRPVPVPMIARAPTARMRTPIAGPQIRSRRPAVFARTVGGREDDGTPPPLIVDQSPRHLVTACRHRAACLVTQA